MSEKLKLITSPLMRFAHRAKPQDFIKGPDWRGREPRIDALARGHERGKFLYHSSPADPNDLKYGIEPRNPSDSNWTRENALGEFSVGDGFRNQAELEEYFEALPRAAWFSDTPSWVDAFVSRKLNKDVDDVTQRDVLKHGHLAILPRSSLKRQERDVFYIDDRGIDEGLQTLSGQPKKVWQTPLHSYDDRFGNMQVQGAERNEYLATESLDPLAQLTGESLLSFLKATGYMPKKYFSGGRVGALNMVRKHV